MLVHAPCHSEVAHASDHIGTSSLDVFHGFQVPRAGQQQTAFNGGRIKASLGSSLPSSHSKGIVSTHLVIV